MRKGYADIPEGQVSYRMEGSGDPLLLLHQTPFSSEEFLRMIPILSKNYRVVAMETLGYGYSDNPPREYEVEDFAQSVINFLNALGIKKTSIAGHHTGSSIAVEVAAAYPEYVDKLILSGCPLWEMEKWEELFENITPLTQLSDDGSFLINWWNLFKGWSPQAKPEFLLKPLALALDGLTKPHDAHFAVSRHDVKQRLPLIKSPTLLISGSEDLFIDLLEDTKSLIPRCKTCVIDGGGVLICFDKPNEFAQAIIEFMENPQV